MVDKIEYPETYQDRYNALEKELKELYVLTDGLKADFQKARLAEWIAIGGCQKCMGRGWVVVWDTMDSMSGCYAEYGKCLECNGKDDPAPNFLNNYDLIRGTKNVLAENPQLKQLLAPFITIIASLVSQQLDIQDKTNPTKDSIVVVKKGRKIPKGTIGKVFWYGSSRMQYNSYDRNPEFRIGFKDEHGEVYWTTTRNVEVVIEDDE